jgi:hypothetical protein
LHVLNKLFSFLGPPKWRDPFFGSLNYMKAAPGNLSYWEGERSFRPLGRAIEIFIDTPSPEEGPSEAQREFFRWVERDYKLICSVVEARFRADPWMQRLMRGAFDEAFILDAFSIPLCHEPVEDWTVTFEATSDDEHVFTVSMRGSEPQDAPVDVDG